MILSRFFRGVPFNWKYAVGEVLLIFVGISLSLMFEEWRASRTKKENERAHLAILMQSVRADIDDATMALQQSELTLRTLDYLISQISAKAPLNDSMVKAFSYIVYNPQFAADKSGIKNLETSGLTIISDINLRVQINYYYERVESNEQWSTGVQAHIDQYMAPRVITDFSDFMYITRGVPIDYKKLQSDYIFLNALKRSQRLNMVSVDRLKSQAKHAKNFLALLEEYQ